MTENSYPPANAPNQVLETNQRLSRSHLWRLQRQFFEQQGLEAWNTGKVPHYATSNPFMANAYGQFIIAFLRDWLSTRPIQTRATEAQDFPPQPSPAQTNPPPLDFSQPVYILELGAGSGRFGYHFLKQFFADTPHPILQDIAVKYIMTDFAPKNLDFWQAHPFLQPFVEQNRLDFACFDITRPEPLHLVQSGDILTADSLKNPLIVLANYFFDSIPQDLFEIRDGQLYETLLTLSAPQQASESLPNELLERLHITYTDRPTSPDYYDNSAFNQLLQTYEQQLNATSLMLPIVGLQGLDYLRRLAGDRLLFLTADKGYSQETDLKQRPKPKLVFHQGCFSLSVNFHAIGQYVQNQGGQALVPHHLPRSLQVCAFLFGQSQGYLETQNAYHYAIQNTGPDGFFNIKKIVETCYSDLPLQQILVYLRFSGWDHNIFLGCWPALMAQLQSAPNLLQQEIYHAIQNVWEMYYWIGENKDLPFHLAQLLMQMERFGEAIAFLHYSLQLYRERPEPLLHLAICHLNLGEQAEGLALLDLALALKPELKAAQILQQIAITDHDAPAQALSQEGSLALSQDERPELGATPTDEPDSNSGADSLDFPTPLNLSCARLKQTLAQYIERKPQLSLAALLTTEPATLAQLGETFQLSPFERTLFLLCLAIEIEPSFQVLCAQAHPNPEQPYMTLGLALSAFPEADRSVLSANNPLHYAQPTWLHGYSSVIAMICMVVSDN